MTTNKPELCRSQPCGCVACICEHETKCMGYGAKHCGTHPVGHIPVPAYQQPEAAQLVEALERCKFALLNTSVSCQKGVCEVCYCRQCAYDAAHTALAAHRKGGES